MPAIFVDFDKRLHIAINTVHLFYVMYSTKFIDYCFVSRRTVVLYAHYFFSYRHVYVGTNNSPLYTH